jgi:hypothetical protein
MKALSLGHQGNLEETLEGIGLCSDVLLWILMKNGIQELSLT